MHYTMLMCVLTEQMEGAIRANWCGRVAVNHVPTGKRFDSIHPPPNNLCVMSIGRRPDLESGGCTFESCHGDQIGPKVFMDACLIVDQEDGARYPVGPPKTDPSLPEMAGRDLKLVS